jgi:hypothetical protein
MKHARISLAVAMLLGVASVASADPYSQRANHKATLSQRFNQQRSYRSNSYAPRNTNQVTTRAQAAPAPVPPQAPAVAQPRVDQAQPQQTAQAAPARNYRSYSYQPGMLNGSNGYQSSWTGLGKNGDYYSSRADNKVFMRNGQDW